MPAQSKSDRMAEIRSAMEDLDLSEMQAIFADLAQAAEAARESIDEIVLCIETAEAAHADHRWEDRDDSLAEIPDALGALNESLIELDACDESMAATVRVTVSQIRDAATDITAHADAFVEA